MAEVVVVGSFTAKSGQEAEGEQVVAVHEALPVGAPDTGSIAGHAAG